MSWRNAFMDQARSDGDILAVLTEANAAYCHRLHYLQMSAEKISKALLTDEHDTHPPESIHSAFVKCLQTIKVQPHFARHCGYPDKSQFKRFIDSLLPLARQIEKLAPSSAGRTHPNPEYPWQDANGLVRVPCEYDFPEFAPSSAQMIKITRLLDQLLKADI